MINNFSSLLHDILDNEQNPLYALLDLAEIFQAGNAEQRTVIREGWDFKRRWFIPGLDYSDMDKIIFAPLVGVDKDGLNAEARIKARLIYHAIQNAQYDFRDNTLDIALCYHAALAAGLDAVRLLEESARVSEQPIAGILTNFSRGQPERRCLWSYGFHAVPVENGIAFEWIGNDSDYDSRKPTHLDSMGREIEG